MMRKSIISALLLAAGLSLSAGSFAADEEIIISESVRNRVEARVEAVDLVNRDLTIKMPDGEIFEFKSIDPKVTHFEKVKINDKVNVGGSETVAIVISKGTAGVRRIVTSEGRDVTADGVGVLRSRATYNDIVGIDREKGIAQVKNPEGKVIEIAVPNKEVLGKAAVGDQVIVFARATVQVWGNNE
jgi:hypothetical protein